MLQIGEEELTEVLGLGVVSHGLQSIFANEFLEFLGSDVIVGTLFESEIVELSGAPVVEIDGPKTLSIVGREEEQYASWHLYLMDWNRLTEVGELPDYDFVADFGRCDSEFGGVGEVFGSGSAAAFVVDHLSLLRVDLSILGTPSSLSHSCGQDRYPTVSRIHLGLHSEGRLGSAAFVDMSRNTAQRSD